MEPLNPKAGTSGSLIKESDSKMEDLFSIFVFPIF